MDTQERINKIFYDSKKIITRRKEAFEATFFLTNINFLQSQSTKEAKSSSFTHRYSENNSMREEMGVKYFSSHNGGHSYVITFFVGKDYENADKRGKAIFSRNEWQLVRVKNITRILMGREPVKKFRIQPQDAEMIGRIALEPNGDQNWQAVLVETKVEMQTMLEKPDITALLITQPKKKRKVLFTGDRDFVFQKTEDEVKKRMIAALRTQH